MKYFFPLPLQRLKEDSTLECHVHSLHEALEYWKKYISVYDKWFFRDKDEYKNLKEKIDREYKCLGKYYAFAPPHLLTCFDLYEITINCMIKY